MGKKIYHQVNYPNHRPSPNELKNGELSIGDLITNMVSGAVWPATEFDVNTMKPDTHDTHKKFRKMLPII